MTDRSGRLTGRNFVAAVLLATTLTHAAATVVVAPTRHPVAMAAPIRPAEVAARITLHSPRNSHTAA